jgi:predicted metal-binding membrane protein/pimeloyl-ACP methyl ester carboxylesterase
MTNIRAERLALPAAVAVAAWWFVLHGAGMPPMTPAMPEMSGMPGMSSAPAISAAAALPALIAMWVAMMAAMMLPGAAPWIAARGTPFAAGYLLVWTVFGAGAASVQWALDRAGALSGGMALNGAPLGALVVAAVGVYELTPFKNACLQHCRVDDRARRAGIRTALADGVRQGMFCLGCCWALMALLFVAGVMNAIAMLALTAFVVVEKLAPPRAQIARIAGVALLAFALVPGFAPRVAAAGSARETPAPCNVSGFHARALCGSVAVRESDSSGRTIRIAYVVVPAERRNIGAVVVVGGGPGQPGTEFANIADPAQTAIHRDHDLLFVDQRGTGRSHPLQCPELFASRAHAFAELFPSEELRACRARLAQDADLNAYGTDRAANDLDALRAALGYPTLSFDSASYASQFAFVYLRRHPKHVRALLLQSVAPTFIKLPLPYSRGAQQALDDLFTSCAADAGCARAFPALRSEWAAVASRYASSPQRVTLSEHGRTTTVLLSNEVFAERIREALYSPFLAAAVPAIVHAAAHGDDGPLARLVALEIDGFANDLAMGENLSVACAEDVAFITPAERAQAARTGFLGDLRIRAQQRACALWNVRRAPASFIEPVRSNVPVLMISGSDDPATPPWLGARQLPYLSDARQILVPGGGHGSSSPCLTEIGLAFLADPRPTAARASCAAANQRPPFVLDLARWFSGLRE